MENIVIKQEPDDFSELFDRYTLPQSFVLKQEPEEFSELFERDTPPQSLAQCSNANAIGNVSIKKENPDEDSDIEDFFFESDHPAYKNNADYKKCLKAIFILEAQRARAVKAIDILNELHEKAVEDPIKFVENLQKGKVQMPPSQKIYQPPSIDWGKYALNCNSSTLGRKQTRLSKKYSNDAGGKPNPRGETKSRYGLYWTAEEQKKLEELLEQFPPEEVESHRWAKIANCLENRTPLQVASRVQKYFIKLTKAGLPVPGRRPNTSYLKKNRRTLIRHQPSTFLVSQLPPVYMPDDDDEEFNRSYTQPQRTCEDSLVIKEEVVSEEEGISPDLKNTEEYQEMMLIKKILKERENSNSETEGRLVPQPVVHRQPSKTLPSYYPQRTDENFLNSDNASDEEDINPELQSTKEYQEMMLIKKILKERERPKSAVHVGYKCFKCKTSPIVGTRFHCMECNTSVDFCSDCADDDYELDQHSSEHHLKPIKQISTSYVDPDYLQFHGNNYNYLDPNFMPVTEDPDYVYVHGEA